MEKYANRNGDSGVAGYEIGADFIRVQFKDGAIYLYNNSNTGAANIEQMKQLAIAGAGLNSFISRYVRKAYARKER